MSLPGKVAMEGEGELGRQAGVGSGGGDIGPIPSLPMPWHGWGGCDADDTGVLCAAVLGHWDPSGDPYVPVCPASVAAWRGATTHGRTDPARPAAWGCQGPTGCAEVAVPAGDSCPLASQPLQPDQGNLVGTVPGVGCPSAGGCASIPCPEALPPPVSLAPLPGTACAGAQGTGWSFCGREGAEWGSLPVPGGPADEVPLPAPRRAVGGLRR